MQAWLTVGENSLLDVTPSSAIFGASGMLAGLVYTRNHGDARQGFLCSHDGGVLLFLPVTFWSDASYCFITLSQMRVWLHVENFLYFFILSSDSVISTKGNFWNPEACRVTLAK